MIVAMMNMMTDIRRAWSSRCAGCDRQIALHVPVCVSTPKCIAVRAILGFGIVANVSSAL